MTSSNIIKELNLCLKRNSFKSKNEDLAGEITEKVKVVLLAVGFSPALEVAKIL